MKKLLSIVLAFCLLCSLAALCGCRQAEKTADPAQTDTPVAEEPSAVADPAAPLEPDPVDAPAQELVAIIVPTMGPEAINAIVTLWCEDLSAAGYNAQYASTELDVAQYIPLMENYMTMGAKLICLSPMDPAGLRDIVERARAEGILVTMLAIQPEYEIDGGLTTDNYATGLATAALLLYFMEQKWPDAAPDSIPVAVSRNQGSAEGVQRSQGFQDAIEADETAFIGYVQDVENNTAEVGFNFVQSALTADPGIRLFLIYDADMLVGCNNYIMAMTDVDHSEFCVVAAGNMNPEIQSLIDASATDAAVVRGLCVYGGETPGLTLANVAKKLLSGAEASPYWEYDAISTVNSYGFVYEG